MAVATTQRSAVTGAPPAARWRRVPAEPVIFVLALLARTAPTLSGGGFGGLYTYDPGVYYAAGAALGYGRVPYRDFVFLHPPGVVLVTTPFAWIGRLTTDHTGFVIANIAFMALGAFNAVLVMRVVRRMGFGRRAALAGGIFYAAWLGSIAAEFELRLETLGNCLVLLGLLSWLRSRDRDRPVLLAGIALGAAVTVKIWYVVPLAAVMIMELRSERARRSVGVLTAGAAGAMAAVAGPFFFITPVHMWQMVIEQQLGRPPQGRSVGSRLGGLTGIHRLAPDLSDGLTAVLIPFVVALVATVFLRAWQVRGARPFVVLAVAQVLILCLAPSWFGFYADFVAPALAICAAAALVESADAAALVARARPVAGVALGSVVVASIASLFVRSRDDVVDYPRAAVSAAVADRTCVTADSPMALIQVDALGRGLRAGCPNWIDVSGRVYGVDAPRHGEPRPENTRWLRDLVGYLRSGDAALVLRPRASGLGPKQVRELQHGGVLARVDGFVVYRGRGL